MSFRIQTQSLELRRELEKKLGELEGQLEGDFDYEISAEVLPAGQALERAGSYAERTGADSIFVAAGIFSKKEVAAPPRREETIAKPQHEPGSAPITTEVIEQRHSVVDREKIQKAVAEKSARAREWSAGVASRTGAFLKVAGSYSAEAIGRTGKWLSLRGTEAKVLSGELRKRIAEKAGQSKQSAAEWNARRRERQALESKLRADRERASHREAELAAAAAHIMHREQKKKEAEQTAIRQKARVVPAPTKVTSNPQRDSWPVWRNAFAAAACVALIGIFLLAAGGKQTKASPATSAEIPRPALPAALALPAVVKANQLPKPVAQKPTAASATISKPSPRKRVARSEDESFQEVTVRHYPNASPLAPPKKDAKGVVQISDME